MDQLSPHPSYTDLIDWGVDAGAIGREDGEKLAELGRKKEKKATTVLSSALRFREAVYRILLACAQGHKARNVDLEALNAAFPSALGRMTVNPTSEGYDWSWQGSGFALDRILWPVAKSAGDLLTSPETEKIRACPGCGWLFLDTSRNGRRRWCDMKICGNRAKVRRYRLRKEKQKGFECNLV